MQQEYARHGLQCDVGQGAPVEPGVSSATDVPDRRPHDEWQLLFVGRMDRAAREETTCSTRCRASRARSTGRST